MKNLTSLLSVLLISCSIPVKKEQVLDRRLILEPGYVWANQERDSYQPSVIIFTEDRVRRLGPSISGSKITEDFSIYSIEGKTIKIKNEKSDELWLIEHVGESLNLCNPTCNTYKKTIFGNSLNFK